MRLIEIVQHYEVEHRYVVQDRSGLNRSKRLLFLNPLLGWQPGADYPRPITWQTIGTFGKLCDDWETTIIDMKKPVINPVLAKNPHEPISASVFVLARKFSEALIVDGEREGYNLEAGLYGPELSQLLVEIDGWRKNSEVLEKLRALMGYVENGSSRTISISQEDVSPYEFTVSCYKGWSVTQLTVNNAIHEAYEKYAEKFNDNNSN